MRIFCLFFAVFLLMSCEEKDEFTEQVREYFSTQHIEFDKELRHCLIIPGGGCSSCVTSGINFVSIHSNEFSNNQNENMVIFTSVISPKILRRSMDKTSMEELNYVLDTLNIYTVELNENIYPIILYLRKGEIVKADMQSPEKNGPNKLIEDL